MPRITSRLSPVKTVRFAQLVFGASTLDLFGLAGRHGAVLRLLICSARSGPFARVGPSSVTPSMSVKRSSTINSAATILATPAWPSSDIWPPRVDRGVAKCYYIDTYTALTFSIDGRWPTKYDQVVRQEDHP